MSSNAIFNVSPPKRVASRQLPPNSANVRRTVTPVLRHGSNASVCRLLAQSGHSKVAIGCPLSGVKRTSAAANPMSAFDPKRTLNAPNGPAVEAGFSYYQNAPLSRYDAAS
jgi:hypothetical protein